MAAEPEHVTPVRDRIHNLDLNFPEHQKIFDRRFPPPTGNPGEDYNCRCQADPFIPTFVWLITPQEAPIKL